MDGQELRELCMKFRGSSETFPFGWQWSVFKVAGKMFALAGLDRDPLSVSVKCEPLLADQLRAAHPAVMPGYHLNKRHWNTVLIDGSLPDEMIANMIEDSYDLVVSKLSRAIWRWACAWSSQSCSDSVAQWTARPARGWQARQPRRPRASPA